MGGVVAAITGKKKGHTPIAIEAVKNQTQATESATVQESEEREGRRNKRMGKKKLQIPMPGNTSVGTGGSGGTGLGTGA